MCSSPRVATRRTSPRYLADADAIILFHDIARMTDATFAKARRCKVIVRAGVGYNNVDLPPRARRGIAVCNVPDYGTEEVADHAIMLLLAVARHLPIQHDSMRAGAWDYLTGRGTPPAPGQDARPGRLRPDRLGHRAPGQGVRARRGLLRPARPAGAGEGPRRPPRVPARDRSWSRAISSACTATSTTDRST